MPRTPCIDCGATTLGKRCKSCYDAERERQRLLHRTCKCGAPKKPESSQCWDCHIAAIEVIPTPEEVAATIAEIRAEWDAATEYQRRAYRAVGVNFDRQYRYVGATEC